MVEGVPRERMCSPTKENPRFSRYAGSIRRKRLDVLLEAASMLRDRIPQLEIRIVGNGPEYRKLQQICADLRLESTVRWLGDVSRSDLAAEYNRAHVFCLPSVQEDFGIVFLEAMAAGKPIVAARAAAIPEVVRDGIIVEPENSEALAEGIIRLYRDPALRSSLAASGLRDVEQFEMFRISGRFMSAVASVAPALRLPEGQGIEHAG